ncbi:MAG: hypothetical protein ABIP20_00350 [Chthoniobacteraceae bacterium]
MIARDKEKGCSLPAQVMLGGSVTGTVANGGRFIRKLDPGTYEVNIVIGGHATPLPPLVITEGQSRMTNLRSQNGGSPHAIEGTPWTAIPTESVKLILANPNQKGLKPNHDEKLVEKGKLLGRECFVILVINLLLIVQFLMGPNFLARDGGLFVVNKGVPLIAGAVALAFFGIPAFFLVNRAFIRGSAVIVMLAAGVELTYRGCVWAGVLPPTGFSVTSGSKAAMWVGFVLYLGLLIQSAAVLFHKRPVNKPT